MFYFKSLVLTGTIPHRNTRLDFTPGVHVVRGPNFCGKSVMFQLLTRIVTGEMPYAAAKKKKENQGRARLSFDRNDIPEEVTLDLSTNKIHIVEDGRALSYKQPAALAKLESILPFTLPSFQNHTYISNDTFPFLLRGSPAQRKMLFEHLFDIDTDAQYKLFYKMNDNMEKLQTKREALQALDRNPVYESEILHVQRRLLVLEKELEDLQKVYDVWAKYAELEKAADAYQDDFATKSTTYLADRLKVLNPKSLQSELEEAREYEINRKRAESVKHIHMRMDALAKYSKPKLVNGITDTDLTRLLNLLREEYLPLPSDEPLLVNTDSSESQLQLLLRRHKALSHAEICPLCETTITKKRASELLKDLDSEIDRITRYINKSSEKNDSYEYYKDVLHTARALGLKWDDIVEISDEVEYYRKYLEYRKCKDDEAVTLAFGPVKNLKKTRNVTTIESDLRNCLADYEAINTELALREFTRKNKVVPCAKRDLDNLQERVTVMRDKLSEMKVSRRNYKELRTEIRDLSRRLESRPIVASLKQLYGPKGLRAIRVRESVASYIENLNAVAPSVLPGYIFSAEVSDTGIEINCDRKAGFSDIRRFSGAEGKLLPLLSLMALHPILPANRQTNVLILDEVEAGMDSYTIERFVDLLPDLQKIYESLWVVTPQSRVKFPIILEGDVEVIEYEVSMNTGGESELKRL